MGLVFEVREDKDVAFSHCGNARNDAAGVMSMR